MNVPRSVLLCSLLLSLCFVVSCASHKTSSLPPLTMDVNAQKTKLEEKGFVSMAKPIYNQAELKTFFDRDLIVDDVLPVHIYLLNKSYGKPCTFNVAGINLLDSSGSRVPMLSMEQLMDKVQKSHWRSLGWGAAFGLLGAIPSSVNVARTNEKIRVDYEGRVLKNGTVFPGASAEGIAFFSIPANTSSLDGWKLTTVIADPSDSTNFNIEHLLEGTIETREKEEQEQTPAPK
ncbi:MAG: hypothetical protein A4E57_02431 [Syntrophorhabdaceae bacterium PtaU1.Bin034]|nr:MAG: hypothetical protein A4E57_02431 [Syntrophorhabdaceae bacterium PtaU1.Bin034]